MRIYGRNECLEIALRVFGFFTGRPYRRPTKDDREALEKCAGPENKGKPASELARIVIHHGGLE
jgi:hypothetical protein